MILERPSRKGTSEVSPVAEEIENTLKELKMEEWLEEEGGELMLPGETFIGSLGGGGDASVAGYLDVRRGRCGVGIMRSDMELF
jgi:hypothetical protein